MADQSHTKVSSSTDSSEGFVNFFSAPSPAQEDRIHGQSGTVNPLPFLYSGRDGWERKESAGVSTIQLNVHGTTDTIVGPQSERKGID